MQLPGQPGDVRAAGEPQVAQNQVGEVAADARERGHVLGAAGKQPPKLGVATASSNALAVRDSMSS